MQRLLKEEHTDAVLVIKTSSSGGPLLRMARRGYCRDSAFPHCFGEVRQIKSRRAVLRAEGKNVGGVDALSASGPRPMCMGQFAASPWRTWWRRRWGEDYCYCYLAHDPPYYVGWVFRKLSDNVSAPTCLENYKAELRLSEDRRSIESRRRPPCDCSAR